MPVGPFPDVGFPPTSFGAGPPDLATPSSTATPVLFTSATTTTQTITSSLVITSGQSVSTNSSSVSFSISATPSSTSSFSSSPSRLGSIVGGVIAFAALILISIFLLLNHRSSQRKIRSRPISFDSDRQNGLGGYVNSNESRRLETSATLTSASVSPFQIPPPNIFPTSQGKHGLVTGTPLANDAMREERAEYTLTSQRFENDTHLQIDASTNAGHPSNTAPPAYDSLSSLISHANSQG